ncbi:MAG: hypothetical protein ACPL1K_07715, partial [Candidatus Kryptoniota bacterium]
MKVRIKKKGYRIALFIFILGMMLVPSVSAEMLEDLNAELSQEGLQWTAGETSISRLNPEEQQALLGGLPTPPEEINPAQIWEQPEELVSRVYPETF